MVQSRLVSSQPSARPLLQTSRHGKTTTSDPKKHRQLASNMRRLGELKAFASIREFLHNLIPACFTRSKQSNTRDLRSLIKHQVPVPSPTIPDFVPSRSPPPIPTGPAVEPPPPTPPLVPQEVPEPSPPAPQEIPEPSSPVAENTPEPSSPVFQETSQSSFPTPQEASQSNSAVSKEASRPSSPVCKETSKPSSPVSEKTCEAIEPVATVDTLRPYFKFKNPVPKVTATGSMLIK